MDRLAKKIDNAKNFDNDREGVILSEIEMVNDTLSGGELAKEETVKNIEISIGNIFKDIGIIKGDSPTKEELIELIKPLIPKVKDGYTPIKGKDYFDGKDANEEKIISDVLSQIPPPKDGKTPIKGRDYLTDIELELIKTEIMPVKGEDYLTEEEIKRIKKELTPKKGKDYFTKKEIERIKKEITPVKGRDYFDGINYTPMAMGGAGGHGRDDLTSQCNGVLKVFVLNNSYRPNTVTLYSTQFPIIYRPIVDFTESGDKQITLTSEVSAPLENQTLICAYEKP